MFLHFVSIRAPKVLWLAVTELACCAFYQGVTAHHQWGRNENPFFAITAGKCAGMSGMPKVLLPV